MQFYFFLTLLATATAVLALPSGHTFMRAPCDIAGCVAALAPGVVSCAGAAAAEGANVIADAGCLASAVNTVENLPADCDQCLKEFDIQGKAEAAGNAVKNAVGDAVDEVGDKIGSIF